MKSVTVVFVYKFVTFCSCNIVSVSWYLLVLLIRINYQDPTLPNNSRACSEDQGRRKHQQSCGWVHAFRSGKGAFYKIILQKWRGMCYMCPPAKGLETGGPGSTCRQHMLTFLQNNVLHCCYLSSFSTLVPRPLHFESRSDAPAVRTSILKTSLQTFLASLFN